MGDKLERYVRENRSKFDQEKPSDKLWNQIDKRLSERGRSNSIGVWKVVAAVLFLLSLGLLLERQAGMENAGSTDTIAEIEEVEQYYSQLISEKKQEILKISDDSLTSQFLEELDFLDSSYVQLKSTFGENISDERVKGAMIENLQLRIQILNRQLEILKNVKKQENEKVNDYET